MRWLSVHRLLQAAAVRGGTRSITCTQLRVWHGGGVTLRRLSSASYFYTSARVSWSDLSGLILISCPRETMGCGPSSRVSESVSTLYSTIERSLVDQLAAHRWNCDHVWSLNLLEITSCSQSEREDEELGLDAAVPLKKKSFSKWVFIFISNFMALGKVVFFRFKRPP